jgi:hypothetical protein
MNIYAALTLSCLLLTSCSAVNSADASGTTPAPASGAQAAAGGLGQSGARAKNAPAVAATGGIQLTLKQGQYCRALAPADWALLTNPQASTVELFSPDKRIYAGWGVTAVNPAMRSYYGDLYGDPETSIRTLASMIAKGLGDQTGMQYTSAARPLGDYFTARAVESQRKAGLVFYHIYPQPGGTYIESVYFAITDKDLWQTQGPLALNVAASIRATTQLLPPPPRGGSSRADDPSGPIDSTYNKELGWQRVHSSSTGENYIVSPSDYQDNGPDGAGYYRKAGNSYEKLTLGWSSY